MENGLLYILAFSAMAIALFACVLPQAADLDLAYNVVLVSGDETEINAALNSLTSGRTWIETVFLSGTFTLNGAINLPSYSKLILDGTVTMANNINESLIVSSETVSIEVTGGTWNANGANQPQQDPQVHGFNLTEVVGYYIHDLTLKDANATSLFVQSGYNGTISHNWFSGSGHNCIWLNNGASINVADNHFFDYGSDAIDFRDGITNVRVSGNVIDGNNAGNGIMTLGASKSIITTNLLQNVVFGVYLQWAIDIEVRNNHIVNTSDSAIIVRGTTTTNCRDNAITGNFIEDAYLNGVDVAYSSGNEISYNTLKDCNRNGLHAGASIYILGNSTYPSDYNDLWMNQFIQRDAYQVKYHIWLKSDAGSVRYCYMVWNDMRRGSVSNDWIKIDVNSTDIVKDNLPSWG